jgi:hypothetical protein
MWVDVEGEMESDEVRGRRRELGMRSLRRGVTRLVAAVVIVTGVGAGSALAAGPLLTIRPGGSFTGGGKLNVSIGSGVSISCKSTIAGTSAAGVVQGGEIGSISAVSKCVGAGPIGLTITVTFSAGKSWPMGRHCLA